MRANNITIRNRNSATHGNRTLMTLDPNIWNKLPENIQYETSHHKFNEYITLWSGPKCGCNFCKYLNKNL